MTRLTREEERALERHAFARDWADRFELLRLAARARIRVGGAAAAGLDPLRRAQARRLAALTHRVASGYERLEHLEGARRWAARLARHARRRAGIGAEQ